MGKAERYHALVEERKACAGCPKLANASTIDGGCLDSDEIGPYSQWQGNLDAALMVVAQDFADIDGFRKLRGWPGADVGTNQTLVELIAEASISIQPPRYGIADDRVFFTNAVLCMKTGGMQASIAASCFERCGKRFLRPTIELVSPRVVVSLGTGAMKAVCRAYDLQPPGKLSDVVAQPIPLGNGPLLMPLYHPSRTVLNVARSLEAQKADWREVGRVLSPLKAAV